MLGFAISFLYILAESAPAGDQGGALAWWYENVDPYMNYPGFEAWRFINLIIFFGILAYLIKRPLSDAFKAKREKIRAELIRAEEEKKEATARLAEAEAKLARLDTEQAALVEDARADALAENSRIKVEIESESKRLRSQAEGEVLRKSQQVRKQLKRFSAEESIRLAEEKIRRAMSAETDRKLVKANIESIGGMR
ncbi:MAG TPA: ATP synthase F0 subunit B [Aridibacter sp.]|nr:ATP synthase F0 subunit B [Aridibacter sp.]